MTKKSLFHLVLSCLIIASSTFSYGQKEGSKKVEFVPYEDQLFGFDAYLVSDWEENYHVSMVGDSNNQQVAYKSVAQGYMDSVNIVLPKGVKYADLSFVIADSTYELEHVKRSENTVTIVLPMMNDNYTLTVRKGDKIMGMLRVIVYPESTVDIVIVPLLDISLNDDSLYRYLNRVYQQTGLNVTVEVQNKFKTTVFTDTVLSNPSLDKDRFTSQMTEIRNEYFDEFIDRNPKSYYVFLTNGFVDQSIVSYSIRNKAVAFVKANTKDLFRIIAKELGYGIGALEDTWEHDGPDKGSTRNLMDIEGTELTYSQWEAVQLMHKSVSYYDDYEDVKTSNGIIAYYLWEEDANGDIILTSGGLRKSIRTTFKRNTYSLHLDIDNFLFYQLFYVFSYPICLLHIFGLLLLGILSVYTRRKIVQKVDRIRKYRLFRWATRLVVFSTFLAAFYGAFLLINEGYYMFEVDQGELKEYSGMSINDVSSELVDNNNVRRSEEARLGSQILLKKGNKWSLEKKKRVLYFELKKTKSGGLKCKLSKDSDSLFLKDGNFKRFAHSHYMVYTYLDEEGQFLEQRVFNFIGVDITEKLRLPDPAKRILLFVNGYRPTSLGNTFEENFDDIILKGLEFSDSKNLIYKEDRYLYWKPWSQINVLFEKKLNPTETYYADGHHSVATANHTSLIDFTTLSQKYPKRCRNPKHHVCKKSEKGWSFFGLRSKVKTVELLNLESNKEGFDLRRNNGRIAGRNLIQQLNELPNKSENDTLFIVAHSMGYAYSLGMIEKLRGKINFGGLYIIAAENAEAGSVKPSEWQEIWQYGSDFEAHKYSAPCLLDGIAPQTKVGGLLHRQRAYIPEADYKKMGFFNSHFIGNYTWILDLKEGDAGYIEQR
ncbi:MAG: hypothetical protein ACJASQ_004068 [Crocinitomicaceae bacterium]